MVWGATFTLVKSALADASPLFFNLLRMALATAVLLILNWRHLRGIPAPSWTGGALAGLFLATGYHLQTLGLTQTTAVKSAFVTGLVVIFVPCLTLISRVRPPGTSAPGLPAALSALLAFAGLLLITTPAGTQWRGLLASMGAGDLLTLAAALAFAAHLLTVSRYSPTMPAGLLATLQVGFCTLFMLLTQPLERPHAVFTPRLITALLVCSLLATAAAFTIQSFAQQTLPPTETVLLIVLEPVFGALTSLLVLHEALAPRALLGASLIFLGILLVQLLPSAHSSEIPA